jgi:3-dehydroquinate dehydratase-2
MAKSILVLHGPNLDRLGERQPEVYGFTTLSALNDALQDSASKAGARLASFQSNSESELVLKAQGAKSEGFDFIVVNPAAFTHTSVALRDAIAVSDIPYIEVHISNVHARETFRHTSYFSDKAVGVICGLGLFGYQAAIQYAIAHPD